MLVYYRRYVIACCAVAVGVPVVASTVYAAVTGSIMAASLDGLVIELVLLFGSLLLAWRVLGRRADARTERIVALYDEDCDPEAFLEASQELAGAISEPCAPAGAWFMGCYGQALLDAGRGQEARGVLDALGRSAKAARRRRDQASIRASEVPLALKLDGPQGALAVVDAALDGASGAEAPSERAYLEGQRRLLSAQVAGERAALEAYFAKAQADKGLPMRQRVESAWQLARLAHEAQDAAREREELAFVAEHGNQLALAKAAREQLAS